MFKNGFCRMSVGVAAMFLLSMTASGQGTNRTEQKGVTYSINVAGMTDGISYPQIKRVTDWQLSEDNQRSALADVVRRR